MYICCTEISFHSNTVYLDEEMRGFLDVDRTQPLLAPLYQSPQGLYFLDEGQTVRVLLHLPPGKFCQGVEITVVPA